MKCIRCGDNQSRKICYSCLNKWTDMRTAIFEKLVKTYGQLSKENHPIFIKETKRLEKNWRKDKDQFSKALESLGSAQPVA